MLQVVAFNTFQASVRVAVYLERAIPVASALPLTKAKLSNYLRLCGLFWGTFERPSCQLYRKKLGISPTYPDGVRGSLKRQRGNGATHAVRPVVAGGWQGTVGLNFFPFRARYSRLSCRIKYVGSSSCKQYSAPGRVQSLLAHNIT
jgi:hypothetical protein